MATEGIVTIVAFLMVSSAVLLLYTLVSGRRTRVDERLEDLERHGTLEGTAAPVARRPTASQFTQTTLPKLGSSLMPADEGERTLLRSRMIHAGFYGPQAMAIFLGVKLLLMVGPAVIGLLLGALGLVPTLYAVLAGACLGIVGMIGPSFWLDTKKAQRQTTFRRALPDALDLIVICLDGGLSMTAALKRVSSELKTAHPELAMELNIAQREIQFGRTPGEALQQMGIRSDLEEVRSLASVITQAERFGASLVKSLRVHSETLRHKRQQHAELMAQKAAIKILFPTLLFIFPAIFVVILGPAVFQILENMSRFTGN
jgi:tight adherence protein C